MKQGLLFATLVGVVSVPLALAMNHHQRSRQTPTASLDDQARQQASSYWNRFITKCGSRYFLRTGVSGQIIELKNYRVETRGGARTSAADRLNGFEWSGTTHLLPQLTRIQSGNGPKWSKWFDGWPFGAMGFEASIMKDKGQWIFNNPYGPSTKPTCEMVLGTDNPASIDAISWINLTEGQSMPTNAIIGGVEIGGNNDGARLYVCRAAYNGGLHPGKLIGGNCNIGFGGRELVLSDYQVATGKGSWAKPRTGYAGALIGGSESSRQLYVCRANFRESTSSGSINHGQHPGKLVDGLCNFGFGGRELSSDDFELFYPARH